MLGKSVVVAAIVLSASTGSMVLAANPTTAAPAFPSYEDQSASTKLSQVWSKLTATANTSGSWPNVLQLLGIFFEDMNPTIHYASDVLPEGRSKLVHSVGSVAQATIEWNAANIETLGYTGMFKENITELVIRGSSGSQPDYTKPPSSGGFVGGIALKCFRDGVPSANIFAMHTLTQWDSFNFFRYTLTNAVSPQNLDLSKILIAKKFGTVSNFANHLGLSDFASYTHEGVKEANPVFPFQLLFVPNPELTALYTDTTSTDYFTQLQNVPVGTVMYTIQAIHNPYEAPVKIGSLTTTTQFFTSSYGDTGLFYRHQIKDEDLEIRSDWLAKCPDFRHCAVCPADQFCGTPTDTYSEVNVQNPGAPTTSQPLSISFGTRRA